MHLYTGFKIPFFLCLFAIISIPLIVSHDLAYIFITGKNFTFRVAVEVLFAQYLLLMLYNSEYQPRYSLILMAFVVLVVTSIISAIAGVDWRFSFLGSYLRMDGIVTFIHLFMYFIVLGHVLKTQKQWTFFFYISIVVAFFVAILGIIDNDAASTLGNVQYSAVYLFFSLFFIALLVAQTTSVTNRLVLIGVALMLTYVMLKSGERGVLCAFLFAGLMVLATLSYYQRKYVKYLIIAIGLGSCLMAVILLLFRQNLVHNTSGFSRYFNADLFKQGASIRGNLWAIALNGFTQHPFFGWGMNNFTYVFNQYYDSFYCGQDLWMDRAHNNYLEWLVSGGLVGFTAFLGFLFAPFYYLVKVGQQKFNLSERAILIGLLSGYLVLNLFYFDTLTSSLCFVSILAFIHSKVSMPLPRLVLPKKYIPFTVLPIVVIVTIGSVYYFTIPSLLAAHEAMLATQSQQLEEQQRLMHQAMGRQGIGNQEIMEKYSPVVIQLLGGSSMSSQEKQRIVLQTKEELEQFIKDKPRDPRAYYFLISLSMMMGDFDNVKKTLVTVKQLTPNKEYTMMIEGVVELAQGHLKASRHLFKKSMCLETSKMLYNQVNQTIEQTKK